MMRSTSILAGRYRLEEELGRGGMGVVWQAFDTQENRQVAVKSLLLEQFSNEETQDVQARFQREAKTSLRLLHPHIVQVFDFLQAEGHYYLIMEYLQGHTLKDFLEGRFKLDGGRLLAILTQICDGLAYAHQLGVVHRDIKPDNLFVTLDGEVKIMDFGIARQNNAEHYLLQTQPGIMMGTLNYMSPEQLQDSATVDQRADIFSLGVVMYELLTGKLPFEGQAMGSTIVNILSKEPEPLRHHNPRIPEELETLVLKALVKRRSQRYQSCQELYAALLTLQGNPEQTLRAASEQSEASGEHNTGQNWRRQTIPARKSPIEGEENQTRPTMGSLKQYLESHAEGSDFPLKVVDRDTGCSLEVEPSGLQAWLSLDPTYALGPPSSDELESLLDKAGVRYGLHREVLDLAVRQGFLPRTLVAEGQAPAQGHSARLEYLMEEEASGPALRQDGSVDHRELGLHRSVRAGTPLMRKHPPQPGSPGHSVHDRAILPDPVHELKMLEGLGTAVASDNPNLLIATCEGMPVRLSRSVRVEPKLELKEVGLESGHIRFDGSVEVLGGVQKGFRIEARGDIVVHGTVEDCVLQAGGNIYLYSPVYGGADTLLRCKYLLRARYLQQAQIECGELEVQEGLFHCKTRVMGQARIGLELGRGIVNGGELYCSHSIVLQQAGSASGSETRLAVGAHPQLEVQLSDLEAQKALLQQKLQENIKNMIYLRTQGRQGEMMKKLEQERGQMLFKSNTLTDEIQFLQDCLKKAEQPQSCTIQVESKILSGVRVNISGAGRYFEHETEGPLSLLTRMRDAKNREVYLVYR